MLQGIIFPPLLPFLPFSGNFSKEKKNLFNNVVEKKIRGRSFTWKTCVNINKDYYWFMYPPIPICVCGGTFTPGPSRDLKISPSWHTWCRTVSTFSVYFFFFILCCVFFSKCSRGIYISFWRKADLIKDYAATVQWRLKSPHDVSLETINPSVAPMTVIKYELHMSY